MVFSSNLSRQLLGIFATEAQDHLQAINQRLLALEQQPDADQARQLLAEIFREAHTLKGAARAVNLAGVETLAHRLETLFGRVQSGQLQPGPETFDLVYAALDTVGALVREAASGEAAVVDVPGLVARLEAIGQTPTAPGHGDTGTQRPEDSARRPLPAPSHPPVSPSPPHPVPPPAASPGGETVRVAVTKLDSLMAQVGELQVARIGAEQRLADVRALLESVEAWEAEWRKIRPNYRALLLALDEIQRPGDTETRRRGSPKIHRVTASPHHRASPSSRQLEEFLEMNEMYLRAARERLSDLLRRFEADSRRMAQVAADLQDDVQRTRMLPISTVFDVFPRMVRDLARERNKEMRLVIHGGETEVDRFVLEQIKAPLTHLLHNCVDHGIETPQARLEAGKPREGTVTLTAAQHGSSIVIEVADDGAGIDPARVRASAVEKGLLTAEAAASTGDREALWLIFRSGLSTSPVVTDLSGRGVGLDVVRESVERLHGMIDVDSLPGRGTRFSLRLPLTLATTTCLLAQVGGQTFALPIASVVRIVRVRPDEIGQAEGRAAIRVDGRPVALVRLGDILGDGWQATDETPLTTRHSSLDSGRQPAIVVGSAERRAAFLVDALVSAQEAVIKSLPRPFLRVRHIAGATILGTGEVVLILNVADLLRSAGRVGGRPAAPEAETGDTSRPPVILVADDSFTTRTLEKNILEAAGYRVLVAADGKEAWDILRAEHCDLLVADIVMPYMTGLELTAAVRSDQRLKELPVILVTSLDSREDRERGVMAGADAYIVKNAFDQEDLLATIRRLV